MQAVKTLNKAAARAKAREAAAAARKLDKAKAAHGATIAKAAAKGIVAAIAQFVRDMGKVDNARQTLATALMVEFPDCDWYLWDTKAAALKAQPLNADLHKLAAYRDQVISGLVQPWAPSPRAYGGTMWNEMKAAAAKLDAPHVAARLMRATEAAAASVEAAALVATEAAAKAAAAPKDKAAAKAATEAAAVASQAEAAAKAAAAREAAAEAAANAPDPMTVPAKVRDVTADSVLAAWKRLNRSAAFKAENGVDTLARINQALEAALVACGVNLDKARKDANF